jgi:two-component system sensor histidine kinase RegB
LCVLAIATALALTYTGPAPPGFEDLLITPNYGAYRIGRSIALVIAMIFASAYAAWASAQGARRELALHLTEAVLAREQRLSALGGLAAAVAHELGTPLATITIIASEMSKEAPEGPLRDDAVLMFEQARRCRDILRRLAEAPEQSDVMHERMSLLQFVREVVEPYGNAAEVRVEALVTGPPGVPAPEIWRRAEVLHAISTIVENAYDFARGEVLLTARFDAQTISLEVRDDGPGFSQAILPRLGEPYVTSRPGAEGSRTGHVGMGLGLFIAKTLLERSGAEVAFANGAGGGAMITARWPRERMEISRETA